MLHCTANDLYAYAKIYLNMSLAEVEGLTPAELRTYLKYYFRKRYEEKVPFGMLAAVIANCHVDRKTKPKGYSIEDFIGPHPESQKHLIAKQGVSIADKIRALTKEYNNA